MIDELGEAPPDYDGDRFQYWKQILADPRPVGDHWSLASAKRAYLAKSPNGRAFDSIEVVEDRELNEERRPLRRQIEVERQRVRKCTEKAEKCAKMLADPGFCAHARPELQQKTKAEMERLVAESERAAERADFLEARPRR